MIQNRLKILSILLMTLMTLCLLTLSAFSAENRTTELNLTPTAKTLGKGGYSSSVSFFQYKKREPSKHNQFQKVNVDIGFFTEEHDVYFDADASVLPIRISYGIAENIDISFGGTYSIGTTKKVIADYYQTGDQKIQRSYPQSLFDGAIGLKYSLTPSSEGNVPTVAVGGEVQVGYTADDVSPKFADPTPLDSYPFLGVGAFMAGTQDLGVIVLNGGILIYRSTKPKSFKLGFYVGGELSLTEKLSFIVDLTSLKAISGIAYDYILSPGIRLNLTQSAAINFGFNTATGFQAGIFIGGEAPTALPKEKEKEDLLF